MIRTNMTDFILILQMMKNWIRQSYKLIYLRMTQEQSKYKFDNLQPITFLKKFNKMAEEDQKRPLLTFKNQLKVFPLSKFPLPSFYEQMEGIFQTGTKKKDVMSFNIKTKDQVQDEEFLVKHRNFMTKAIEKIIKENQSQQVNLENYKSQYNPSSKAVDKLNRKSQSQAKLHPNHKIRSVSGKNQAAKDLALKLIRPQLQQKAEATQQEKKNTYLQKIQIERLQSLRNVKKQKIKIKDNSKVTQFLESRHNFASQKGTLGKSGELSQINTGRSIEYNDMPAEDWKKSFIQQLLNLQKQQSSYQEKYCDMVEGEIKKFNEKVKKSVQKSRKQMI